LSPKTAIKWQKRPKSLDFLLEIVFQWVLSGLSVKSKNYKKYRLLHSTTHFSEKIPFTEGKSLIKKDLKKRLKIYLLCQK